LKQARINQKVDESLEMTEGTDVQLFREGVSDQNSGDKKE